MNVRHIRQQEYTGENRCMPCTAVNILIAAFICTILAFWSLTFSFVMFLVSLSLIYFRGYLIPGTPTLTKRYLPSGILRAFGKEHSPVSIEDTTSIDPEKVLMDAGVIKSCDDRTDLCLTPNFHSIWNERIDMFDENQDIKNLQVTLDTSLEQLSFKESGDALVASTEEKVIGQWPSPAAVTADVAAAEGLKQQYPDWNQLNPIEKINVLMSLRVFLKECPNCQGSTSLGQEVVDSCCHSYDVAVLQCVECKAKLFEVQWQDDF